MPEARDRLGRPVPQDSPDAFPTVPERTAIDAEQAWAEAIAHLDAGLPFHAHEVLEQRWRCAPEHERLAWRGLAQWGAALTHEARGNPIGARRLAQRAALTLDEARQPPNVIPSVVDTNLIERSIDAIR